MIPLLGAALLLSLVPASGAALPAIPPGARSLASADSMGYEQFRALPAKEQRAARAECRDWLAASRDAMRAAEGRRPQLPWRFAYRRASGDEFGEFLERSLDYAATAVGYCPYDAAAWTQYAEAGLRIGRDDLAAACVAHADRACAYEADPDARRAHQEEIQRIRAFAHFNLKEYATAREAADAVLARAPREWVVRLIAARCALQLGQYADARRLSSPVPASAREYPLARAVTGSAELGLGDLEAAERAFGEAAELGLHTPEFQNDRGRLMLARERPAEAAAFFRSALQLEPDFVEAACNLATACRRAGDPLAAERALLAQLSRSPADGRLNLALAETFRDLAAASGGDARRDHALAALEQYDLALEHGASATEVADRRASLAIYLGDVSSIEELILSLAEEGRASAHVLTILAREKCRQGRLDIAEGILEMAVAREDASALTWAELGEVRLRRSALEEAREALQTACVMDASLVVSRVNLSLVCELLGDMPGAWAALDEAIELDPQHPLVLERVETAGRL